jgi:pyruvate dehydrogenase (quinone)
VDTADAVGSAWDEALAGDRPYVLDVLTDPEVPPLPPHITFEQARNLTLALAKGDPARRAVVERSLREKIADLLPARG